MIVAKYKFNPSIYSNLIPEFNSTFTDYTTSDVNNDDGTITRTIESDTLPTIMRFGQAWVNEENGATDKSKSLLEILNMNTSNLTNMDSMFRYCINLTSITCNWNTSQVTNMMNTFHNCSKLVSLDLNNWDTSKVVNMGGMFNGCSSLISLDLSNWNTSQVTYMGNMFTSCSSLIQLDVSNWNTSQVTSMGYMFTSCSSLIQLDVSNFDTSNITNMAAMFSNCQSLISLDVSNFDTSKVTNMFAMFNNCITLTKLDVNNFNTSKVTNMKSMFNSCDKLTKLDLSNFDTSKVTDMYAMFNNCQSLVSLDVNNWNTSSVTDMSKIFDYCFSLRKVALKYSNQSTVSKIHELLPDRSSTTEGYILSLLDLTSDKNWEALKFSQNEVYLPQPLRKIGDVKDRFYWDDDKGHYCIEQNLAKVIFDGSDDEDWMKNAFTSDTDARNCYCAVGVKIYPTYSMSSSDVLFDKFTWRNANSWGDTSSYIEDEFLISGNKLYFFKSSISTVDEFKVWLSQNPITLIHPLETPKIIDLPELNKKFSFDTYLPNTSVDVTNLPLQPYKLQLEDDTVRYKSTIEPSTLYTIQFNCLAKSTTNLTLDLGGTKKTVDPIIGVNHVQITTPSELTSNRLFMIGTGIKIKEVIVNKGEMNQYPTYFDGEQSVGELQEDGTYNITIHTDNYTSRWEEL